MNASKDPAVVAPVLILPGYGGSGPLHWQSEWERVHPEFCRVEQRDWEHPDLGEWSATLEDAVAAAGAPPVLVLFVCALNKRRSVTAERIYRDDPRVEVRSAGVRSEAPRRVSEKDLRWADVVFAMERQQRSRILEEFAAAELPPIDVLDIPDDFECMDLDLQQVLRAMLDPEIDARRDALAEDDGDDG